MYSLLKKSKLRWSQSLFFTVIEALSYMIIPLVQKNILDDIVKKDYSKINRLILYMLSLYFLHYVFQIIRSYYDASLSTTIKTEFQKDVYNKMLNSNLSNITKNKVGKLMTIMESDITTVSTFLSSTLKLFTYNIIIIIFLLITMFKLSMEITGIIVFLFLLIYYFNTFHNKKYKKYKVQILKNKEKFIELLNQSILSLKLIKSNNLKKYFSKKLINITEAEKEINVKSIVFSNLLGALTKYTLTGGRVVIFFIGILGIKSGKLTIGSLLALLSYYEFMYNPVLQFRKFLEDRVKTEESYKRIENIFVKDKNYFRSIETLETFRTLEFKKINFSYDTKAVYKDFSYKINHGDKIAIVGGNGKGKSTLINIITGIEKIDSGEIILNDRNFYDINIEDYRDRISILFQENNLFDFSIEENLRLGNDDVDLDEIINICKKLNIHKLISSLPMGYQTRLSHLGSNFSGGEKRKMLLARTFLKNTDVYIFDELTSNLDEESQINILNLVLDLFKDKTILFITHSKYEISRFDKVLNLNSCSNFE